MHSDHGFGNGGHRDRVPDRNRIPRKWTPTQPRNLRLFSEFGGCLVHERTVTFRGASIACGAAVHTPSISARRDNFRDSEHEIGSLVTCTLAYT
jgi:hypothetical protein